MEWFGKVLDKLNRAVELTSAGMLAVMVIVIFLQVIFRSVIKSAIPWSEELARYLMVWITFLGASIAVKRQGHIGVAALIRILSPSNKRRACLLANALSMVFFAAMIVLGYSILGIVQPQLSPAIELSMAVPYSAILAGGTLMLLYSLYDFIKVFRAQEGK
jgi:TRAP-type C4-dicarboxylate transport system permease small subunit